MLSFFDSLLRRKGPEPEIPVCPSHHIDMRLRGKQGRPTRFSDQAQESYTLMYYCPEEGCNQTETRERVRTQIPVPGESPERPYFSREDGGHVSG